MTETLVPKKTYLGDGVYVDIDEQGLILTTENGLAVTNRIVLEAEVWVALLAYVQTLRAKTATEEADD